MTTLVALLRGVNVGGNNKVKMEALRATCEGLGWRDVRTYIQSGNIVFRTGDKNAGARLEAALEAQFEIRTFVVTRTLEEMRVLLARNPFEGKDPKSVVVSFLSLEPTAEAVAKVDAMGIAPEEVRVLGREMFIHFPLGQRDSKLPMAKIEKTLGTGGTGRNWNTVMALLEMADD
jgi:uncharacterized protein (DUF1697 family)